MATRLILTGYSSKFRMCLVSELITALTHIISLKSTDSLTQTFLNKRLCDADKKHIQRKSEKNILSENVAVIFSCLLLKLTFMSFI